MESALGLDLRRLKRGLWECAGSQEGLMRFALVDRVIEEGSDGLVAIKAISAAEEYLADHFPGFAVLPGVLMLEALVQAARQWVQSQADAPKRPLVLAEARNVRYGQLVRPGQSLRLEVRLRKRDASGWSFQAQATVGQEVAVQAQFRLQELPEPQPPGPGSVDKITQ